MRLTLRTMLAYLDDILEPDDSQDIAKKIEESEFATELVHRTRDCIRRLRLGVPPVEGKGLATDANTVAEYLDNTLATDRVPEFEKICLESDVHLAEVAACHQILTLVLGEPAAIDPQSRQRMYRVASEASAPPVQGDAIQPVAATVAVAPPAPPRRPKPEIPDYLREPRSRLWPVVAAMVFGALLTVGALMLFGPADWRQKMTDLANVERPADQAAPADTKQPGAVPAKGAAAVQAQPAAAAEPAAELERPDAASPAKDDAPLAPEPGDQGDTPPAEPGEQAPTPAPPLAADAPAADPAAAPAKATDETDKAAPVPPLPEPSAPAPLAPTPEAPAPEAAPAEPAAKEGDKAAADFGLYPSNSKRQVLLKFDRESGEWKRLPAPTTLAKGDRLLTLPLFRPVIELGTNLKLQPDGAALFELVGWTDDGVPIIQLEFGRMLMMTEGKAGNSIELKLDEHQPQITFVDADATLALEARRLLPPGKDPLAGPAPMAVDAYAINGSIRIRQGDAAPIELPAPSRRVIYGGGIEPPGSAIPAWVNSEALSEVDHRSVTTVEPLLPVDEPIHLVLKELSGDRRSEVRSLAIRSATYLGNFEPCTKALNEKDERNRWAAYIDELRASVARSPDSARQVLEALEKQGADGKELFRMLWGYSADDLAGGAARDLVDGLSHDSLDYRVLALASLQSITGLPTFGYYPADSTRQRASAVKTWNDRLKSGKIVPRSAAGTARSKASAKGANKSDKSKAE